MAFSEDLSAFFEDFGVDGTLNGSAVRGIYDAPGSTALGGVSVQEPQFTLASADVPAAVFGKTLTLPAGSFTVREAVPDGTGLTVLFLSEA